MAIGELIGRLLGSGGAGSRIYVYDCAACDAEFDSAKQPARASCPECLSNEVTQVGTTDSYS